MHATTSICCADHQHLGVKLRQFHCCYHADNTIANNVMCHRSSGDDLNNVCYQKLIMHWDVCVCVCVCLSVRVCVVITTTKYLQTL